MKIFQQVTMAFWEHVTGITADYVSAIGSVALHKICTLNTYATMCIEKSGIAGARGGG